MRIKKRWKVSLKGLFVSLFVLILNIHPISALAAAPVEAVIPVSCIGENTSEAFKVTIQMESEEYQTCNVKELTLNNGEKSSFNVTYRYPGTYRYEIRQERGTDAKTTYDDTVYTVDVYVTEDEEGVMHTEPVIFIKGKSDKCAEASFKNTRVTPTESKTGIVNTGDSTVIVRYILLITGSLISLVLLLVMAKRRKGGEK